MARWEMLPGSAAQGVDAQLAEATSCCMLSRLWAGDVSLWSSDVETQRLIRERLGWLALPSRLPAQVKELRVFADEVRRDGFTHALLIGMGGSSLFAEVCRGLFGASLGHLDLTVLDTTDPSAIAGTCSRLPLARTLVIISSKSGTTIEVRALCGYLLAQARAVSGVRAGKQFIAITDEATPLEAEARRQEFRRVFAHGSATGRDVGGRFSALTWFGLVPAALMGVDLDRLVASAQAMSRACGPNVEPAAHPAISLAAWLAAGAKAGRNKLILMAASSLAPVGAWVEQLVAESTGKAGQGILPVEGEAARDRSPDASDRLVVEMQLAGAVEEPLAGQVDALIREGHPVFRVQWTDRYDLGGEVVRWSLATSLTAALLQLNPFDEPNVQESKARTSAVLEAYVARRAWPSGPPIVEGNDEAWGGTVLEGVSSLGDGLRSALTGLAAGSYVAVLSFLPRSAAVDGALSAFRRRVAEVSRTATTLGIGPRYLHSAGQLHKGGPDHALFIVLTAADPLDVPIPGWPYTFSVLKRAQAYGDAQALMARGRQVAWVHLGQDPARRLHALSAALCPSPPI